MKKRVLFLLLAAALLLTACGGNLPETSVSQSSDQISGEPFESEVSASKDDVSREASFNTEVSLPEYVADAPNVPDVPDESVDIDSVPEDECRVTVKYSSFSEKPFAVVIGQCDIGATVTLKCGDEEYTSESWYGWYSVRFLCAGSSADVVVTQSIDGKKVGAALETKISPRNGSSAEGVVAGGNFQFFYQKCIRDFQHTNLYSDGVLNSLKTRVEGRLANIKKQNLDTEIIYMVVPAAMTVYPELVPKDYEQGEGESRMDQVLNTLNEAGATVIDLRPVFEEHKNDEMPLYFKCDSHWSDYGAFIAYTELFNHIAQKFPDAAPRSIDEFNWFGGYYKTGDMPVYLNMINGSTYESGVIGNNDVLEYGWYRTFADGIPVSEKITEVPRYRADTQMVYSNNATWANTIRTKRDNLPTCIVLRDSFGTQIYDILAERMDKTIYKAMWGYGYPGAEVVSNKADYVIYILAEWNLDGVVYN